jgi:Bifunctional DNA primase/polymerase, N-terminal
LAVRDFDQVEAYRRWSAEHPDEASRLPTVRTARGFHVYGRLVEETFVDFGDGELRADCKHYVLLPPSRHPTGQNYVWLIPLPFDLGDLPLLPSSLMARWGDFTQQPNQPIACVPKAIEDAIDGTLPDGPGQRNRKIFDLARRLKGIGLEVTTLKPLVIEWHRRALPVITTKDFGETWSDFQIAWQRVRKPFGTTVDAAFAGARQAPRTLIDENTELGVLATMCRILSEAARGESFFLSARTVKRLFGISRMSAWRWLESLQFYGFIVAVKKGTLRGRQATVWRYTGKD